MVDLPDTGIYTIHLRRLPNGRWAAEVAPDGSPREAHVAGFSADSREAAVKAAQNWIDFRRIPLKRRGERCQPQD